MVWVSRRDNLWANPGESPKLSWAKAVRRLTASCEQAVDISGWRPAMRPLFGALWSAIANRHGRYSPEAADIHDFPLARRPDSA
ncbi:MAG: hypothetical protein H6R00_3990 [Proteobacteria bacterium]|nr:hypothetical protein [Pseudomonadota bacterium]